MAKSLVDAVEAFKAELQGDAHETYLLGKLKLLDRAVEALADDCPDKFYLQMQIFDITFNILPEDTVKALNATNSGSDLSVELVRRDLTQLSNLAGALYVADDASLDSDHGLRSLHEALASSLELMGALVSRDIFPEKEPWAKKMTELYTTLGEFRSLTWAQVRELTGADKIPLDSSGNEVADGANNTREARSDIITRGQLSIVAKLFANGDGVPAVRKQVLKARLDLDVADQLERRKIFSVLKITTPMIRSLSTSLEIGGEDSRGIAAILRAMISGANDAGELSAEGGEKEQEEEGAAEAGDAADDDADTFGESLTDVGLGSFATEEELVASAAGGAALYGVNLFPDATNITSKPYAPVLEMPELVELNGASVSFESMTLQSTEQSMASSFQSTARSSGITMAKASSTSWGVSGSVSGYGVRFKGSSSGENQQENDETKEENDAFSRTHQAFSSSSTTVETILCPMRSFRIPVIDARLSVEALEAALKVNTLLAARRFLDTFGSHVSNGRQVLGGMFFRNITMSCEKQVETSALLSKASSELESSKSKSINAEAEARVRRFGVRARVSASFSRAATSGSVEFDARSSENEERKETVSAQYQAYVRSMGPNTTTPDLFAEVLLSDPSSWTIIDRGPFEALVPVTNVVENTLEDFEDTSLEAGKLRAAITLLQVAYKQRVEVWLPLKDSSLIPLSLKGMIEKPFQAQEIHGEIGAATIELLRVLDLKRDVTSAKVVEEIGIMVLETAEQMKGKPAGEADFFASLQERLEADMGAFGEFTLEDNTKNRTEASIRSRQLSSEDWNGFRGVWIAAQGTTAIKGVIDQFAVERQNVIKAVVNNVTHAFQVDRVDARVTDSLKLAESMASVIQEAALGMQDVAAIERFYETIEAEVSSQLNDDGKFKFVSNVPRKYSNSLARLRTTKPFDWTMFGDAWNSQVSFTNRLKEKIEFIRVERDEGPEHRTLTVGTIGPRTFVTNRGMVSANGRYKLIQLETGNLVLYDRKTRIWATGTAYFFALSMRTKFTTQGALIQETVNNNGAITVFDNGSAGQGGEQLILRNSGNIEIKDGNSNVIWESETSQGGRNRGNLNAIVNP